MTIRDEYALEAASMYYLQGQTMEAIAKHLNMSRSSVSRLLTRARERGLVRITISDMPTSRDSLAGKLKEMFSVNTTIVPIQTISTETNRLQNVAMVAGERLVDLMTPGATLGVAWGNTTSAVAKCVPHVAFPGSTVVQLNGAATATESGLPYAESIAARIADAFGARMVHFPVPAFFDYAETKQAMWKERSIRRVLDTIENADVALFGIGALSANTPSHVYSGGYLSPAEMADAQADGVIGDVCTYLMRADGSTDMELNERASGPSPETLKKIPRRLCVASGPAKTAPLLAALRSGIITDLVLDDTSAIELMKLAKAATR